MSEVSKMISEMTPAEMDEWAKGQVSGDYPAWDEMKTRIKAALWFYAICRHQLNDA